MDIEEFWKLIDAIREARGGDVSIQVEEIYAFDTL